MMTRICTILILFFCLSAKSNGMLNNTSVIILMDTLPYYQIPDYPDSFNNGTVVGRMVDGLGYRYYWATEGLRDEDLNFRPSDDQRTSFETLKHIYYLSRTVKNVSAGIDNIRSNEADDMDFNTLRKVTLNNIATASSNYKSEGGDKLDEKIMVFKRGDKTSEYPFWHLLNGALADAIYHVGQVVSYRRSSGNPMDPTVNVFIGKNRK